MFYCLDRFVERYGLHGPFLEIGCGRGDVSAHLAAKGWQGTAIDFSEAAVAQASVNLAPFPQVTVRQQALADAAGAFDCVIMWDVLEHMEDDRGALRMVERLLRSRRAAAARRAQQSARVALGRRLLWAFPPLHGGRHDGAAGAGGPAAAGLLGLHVSVVLADAPDVHAVEVRAGRCGRQGGVDEGERNGQRLGRGRWCRRLLDRTAILWYPLHRLQFRLFRNATGRGHEFFVLAQKSG